MIAATISGIWGLGTAIHDIFAEPEVVPSTSYALDPFGIRFAIKNPSIVLPMSETEVVCHVLSVDLPEREISLTDNTFATEFPPATVRPQKQVQYLCPFSIGGFRPSEIGSAKMQLRLSYSTLGFSRSQTSETLSWSRASGTWVVGDLIE